MGLGFPALFFCAVVWQLTPNNCSFPAGHGAVNSLAVQLEQLFTQEAGQQVDGSPDPEDPRTIVRYSNPDPDPDSGGLRPESEQLPRLRPDFHPDDPDSTTPYRKKPEQFPDRLPTMSE